MYKKIYEYIYVYSCIYTYMYTCLEVLEEPVVSFSRLRFFPLFGVLSASGKLLELTRASEVAQISVPGPDLAHGFRVWEPEKRENKHKNSEKTKTKLG